MTRHATHRLAAPVNPKIIRASGRVLIKGEA